MVRVAREPRRLRVAALPATLVRSTTRSTSPGTGRLRGEYSRIYFKLEGKAWIRIDGYPDIC